MSVIKRLQEKSTAFHSLSRNTRLKVNNVLRQCHLASESGFWSIELRYLDYEEHIALCELGFKVFEEDDKIWLTWERNSKRLFEEIEYNRFNNKQGLI